MSEYTYTAEDFEQAQFARFPDGRTAARFFDDSEPWFTDSGDWRSDTEMADAGCIPVYAEPYSPEALQRAWEHGEKPKPGEAATEGMVTITVPPSSETLSVFVNTEGEKLFAGERIVYRPPTPERDPVADLAQAMEDVLPEEAGSPVALRRYAEALAEYGVRVTDDEHLG